jgi:hypothetical protein
MAKCPIFVFVFLLCLCSSVVSQQYFPDHIFEQSDKTNDFDVNWYSGQLKALKEPSLWQMSKESQTKQVYRFLWLRSFHHPVVVRLDVRANGTGILTTKVADGAGGYPPGRLAENRTKEIRKEVVESFLAHVEEVKYWSLPSLEPPNPNMVNLDGAQWVLEGVRNGTYKIVDRWSPEKGPIRDLGLTMAIDLAGMKLLYQDVY